MFRVMFLLLSPSSMLKLSIKPGEDAGAIAEFCGKYIVSPAKVGEGICWLYLAQVEIHKDKRRDIEPKARLPRHCAQGPFIRRELSIKQQFYCSSSVQYSSCSLKGYQATVMVGSPTHPSHLFSIQTLWLVQPGQNSVKVRESEHAWALFACSSIGSLGTVSAVAGKGKKRGEIGKISASEASRGVAWGGGKDGPLSLPQTTSRLALLANLFFRPRRFFSPFSPIRSLVPGYQAREKGSFFILTIVKGWLGLASDLSTRDNVFPCKRGWKIKKTNN